MLRSAVVRHQSVLAVRYAVSGLVLTFALGFLQVAAGIVGPWQIGIAWAVLCVVAAERRHALAWATLVLFPLAMLCLQWLTAGYPTRSPDEDPFGIEHATIFAFIFVSIVTAASSVVFILAVTRDGGWPSSFKGLSKQ